MSCYCDYSGGEGPSFSETRMVKARKLHLCCECREPIKPGETYQRVSGLWDGGFDAFKTCAHCAGLREEAKQEDSEGIAFGQLACWYAAKLSEADSKWRDENIAGPPKPPLWWR